MDLPNTRLWRDDPRPMASSPRTVSLSRFRSLASRRRRSAPAFGRAPITGAQNRKSALTENAPYKACPDFTHVTARRIAQLPKATFVTRLQPVQLPARLRGALPGADIANFVVNLGERRCLRHLQPFELARHRALRAVLASTGSSKGGNCGLALIIVFRHGIPTAPGSTHPVRRSQRRALLSGLWPLLRNQAGQHPVHD